METATIAISGMSCGHCLSAVEKALATVPGLTVDAVAIGSAAVRFEPGSGALAAAESAIDEAGYDVVKGRTLQVANLPKSDADKSDA